MEIVSARNVGQKAVEILEKGGNFRVQGITSRGVFLESDFDWMLFCSVEDYRGPLTINVPDLQRSKGKISRGAAGHYDGTMLRFQEMWVGVDMSDAEVWAYELSGRGIRSLQSNAIEIIRNSAHPVVQAVQRIGVQPSPINSKLMRVIQEIPGLIKQGDVNAAIEKSAGILGLGEGLTPEGDDLLIGLLFYLRIANKCCASSGNNWKFSKEIVSLAKVRTTRLSANLIACAAEGQADERISKVLDRFLAEQEEFEDAVNALMTWGNTSGRMVLAGITAGVLACGGTP